MAFPVAEAVAAGRFDRAILLCGTGIGMAICANKVLGAGRHCTRHLTNRHGGRERGILTMGAHVIGEELAKNIVQA